MKEFLVTCINKPNRESTHEHITHIGNAESSWRITRESAIERIEAKRESFYTLDPISRQKAYIGVVREPGKAPYLRTHADGRWNNNLLSLSECAGACKIIS